MCVKTSNSHSGWLTAFRPELPQPLGKTPNERAAFFSSSKISSSSARSACFGVACLVDRLRKSLCICAAISLYITLAPQNANHWFNRHTWYLTTDESQTQLKSLNNKIFHTNASVHCAVAKVLWNIVSSESHPCHISFCCPPWTSLLNLRASQHNGFFAVIHHKIHGIQPKQTNFCGQQMSSTQLSAHSHNLLRA